jgi:hypothetical protein
MELKGGRTTTTTTTITTTNNNNNNNNCSTSLQYHIWKSTATYLTVCFPTRLLPPDIELKGGRTMGTLRYQNQAEAQQEKKKRQRRRRRRYGGVQEEEEESAMYLQH